MLISTYFRIILNEIIHLSWSWKWDLKFVRELIVSSKSVSCFDAKQLQTGWRHHCAFALCIPFTPCLSVTWQNFSLIMGEGGWSSGIPWISLKASHYLGIAESGYPVIKRHFFFFAGGCFKCIIMRCQLRNDQIRQKHRDQSRERHILKERFGGRIGVIWMLKDHLRVDLSNRKVIWWQLWWACWWRSPCTFHGGSPEITKTSGRCHLTLKKNFGLVAGDGFRDRGFLWWLDLNMDRIFPKCIMFGDVEAPIRTGSWDQSKMLSMPLGGTSCRFKIQIVPAAKTNEH